MRGSVSGTALSRLSVVVAYFVLRSTCHVLRSTFSAQRSVSVRRFRAAPWNDDSERSTETENAARRTQNVERRTLHVERRTTTDTILRQSLRNPFRIASRRDCLADVPGGVFRDVHEQADDGGWQSRPSDLARLDQDLRCGRPHLRQRAVQSSPAFRQRLRSTSVRTRPLHSSSRAVAARSTVPLWHTCRGDRCCRRCDARENRSTRRRRPSSRRPPA